MKERQRKARQDWVLMRVTTVVLVLTDIVVLAIISLMIATYS
jgi:succinate dehydrogenase hydrophobic anchor subunit